MKRLDLTGREFGRLTAKSFSRVENVTRWECECSCGKTVSVSLSNLVSGKTKSCGCLHREEVRSRALNLTGQRFGSLLVIERDEEKSLNEAGKIIWRCECDCGATTFSQTNNLRSGNSQSCGGYHHRLLVEDERVFRGDYQMYAARGFCLGLSRFIELCKSDCHYCGKHYSKGTEAMPGRRRNGIDKMEPSKGYSEGNIVPCCWTCNKMKGVMPYKEFILAAKNIAARML